MKKNLHTPLDWLQCSLGWWVLFGIWLLAFSFATSIPGRDLPEGPFPNFDKAVHFSAFLIGAAVLFPALHLLKSWRLWITASVTFVIVVLFGILDEHKQILIPGRHGGDWADIAANSLGAGVGVVILWALYGVSLAGRRAKAREMAARRNRAS